MRKQVSVEYAIKIGTYFVVMPFVFGVFALLLGGIVLIGVCKYSAWFLIPIVLVATMLPALLYSASLIKWRIWAFNNVINIFELQESRDSQPLLSIAENTTWTLTAKDKNRLAEIEERLKGPVEFTDDPDVFLETSVYYSKPKLYALVTLYVSLIGAAVVANANIDDAEVVPVVILLDIIFFGFVGYYMVKALKKLQLQGPYMVLSNDGITTQEAGFWPWKDISGENSNYIWSGGDSNPYYELQYNCPAGEIVVEQKLLDTSPLKIQHLLYVYRGRHDKKRNVVTQKQLKIPGAVAAMSKWSPFRSKKNNRR